MRKCLIALLGLRLFAATAPSNFEITPDVQSALKRIEPNSLRGNLSFIASDLLAGRDTPSPGLEIAAEYIAAQFRKGGIEAAGDNGYFQTVRLLEQAPDLNGFSLQLTNGETVAALATTEVSVRATAAVDLDKAPLFKLDITDNDLLEKLTPEQLHGKVVLMELLRGRMQSGRSAMSKLREAKPTLLILVERGERGLSSTSAGQLFDPDDATRQTPRITLASAAASRFYDSLPSGLSLTATVALHLPPPQQHPVILHNVVGILRGSDPVLKESCVLLTAHYDHIGQKTTGDGDRIFNGANDDGSGTVSLIEIANALSSLKTRPKRSIVFVAFFGEEKGGFGSRYYAHHPVLPIEKTIADLNLEQVGRTDSTEGEQKDNASLTGFDYSEVPTIVKAAGDATGIKVYQNEANSELYFAASDNVSLAEQGVPAHSLTVAFNYSDYHGLGDEWQKVDYDNMAKVDRMVAVALLMLADSDRIPHWNAGNPKAARYLSNWRKTHHE